MHRMRLDHLSYAAAPGGLAGTTASLAAQLGERFADGGVHPRFGTRNMVLPLTARRYVEVVGVLDHPASDKAPFGQVVRARSEAGGGWFGWVVAVDDITPVEQRLGRSAVPGNRHRPDGFDLRWRQLGVVDAQSDPQLPFLIQWEVGLQQHPSAGASGAVELMALEIAGDPGVVSEWLGEPATVVLGGIAVEWVAPRERTGVVAAHFSTAAGDVRI